ncbi:MAG: 5-dehydro-2-deoxygluconokinase [Chloroflexi bacterium]|nr:5-dehydro-2-deoxygluconokinase [Chloroflexota bacterium]MCY3583464.1 5-dehydro-2-deoxygluconokinase [Chloroflexota bacterium]MCY3716136.1 5-dehydro-2-deoxygluconokinase [Chloroflexota bacterium]MDE2650274.1 5-dehydro-2-deoxygluconokinase [Chloroflexota bacterium]MXX51429.1 5-dehydro-2-deoxygluconokinase [Chloroflexota bacterium]
MPDLITVGRVSLDLFSRDIGAPFPDIRSFETSVGGSPVNIAIGASRLGLRSLAFTAVGDDEVGRFVRRYLAREGVDTAHIAVKAGRRTGMAVVGVQPPDRFPLLFYRENPADIHLSLDEARALPLDEARALQLSGTALSRGSAAEATLYLAERARQLPTTAFLDLDLRPDQWTHALAYGLRIRRLLPLCDCIIGTEEEFYATLAPDPSAVMAGGAVPDQRELDSLLDECARQQTAALIVKRGAAGVSIWQRESRVDVPGFPVEIVNTVGAGDGFASGLICGWARGWGWARAARFGNACGALVVSRQGCARALPTLSEVENFLARNSR